jgi:hypothetical protein
MQALSDFRALCAKATEAEDSLLPRTVEPEYGQVLQYMIDHPVLRPHLGEILLDLATFPGQISPDLVEYCMLELRWPEVKSEARQRLHEAADPRSKRVFECILEAYEDGWNADGYFSRWSP